MQVAQAAGTPGEAAAAPLSARVCDAVCLGFAAWTLCCHAAVAAGASLRLALALFALVAAGAAAAAVRARRRGRRLLPEEAPLPEPQVPPRSAALRAARWVGLALGLAATAWVATRRDPVSMWWLLALLLTAAAVAYLLLEPPCVRAPARGRALEAGLWLLAALCVAYTLVVHRPDADDAFYVNVAVGALDRPDLPLLAVDTLHGRDDLPIHFSAYRVHSIELWNAAVSLVSGIPPLYVFHWISAALAAMLVPLCHARLFRLLTPRVWLWSAVALVAVLALPGETHRWYGNFAFVRMWQGKAVFLFVFTPLVYAYALRFALTGSRRDWGLLAAAQVSALGASASALWAAPAAALAALAVVLRPRLPDLRRLGTGALASSYVVAAGLLLKRGMTAHSPTLQRHFQVGELLGDAFVRAFGDGRLLVAGVGALFVAWACWRRGLAQRFAIAVPLAVTLVLLPPWSDSFVRANATGPSYWRALWALPAPILMALVLVAPLQWDGDALRRWAGRAVAVAATLAFGLLVPAFPGWSARNGAAIDWPRLKVDEAPFRWAQKLDELAPGERIVAPPSVSVWVPTLRHPAYPLRVRNYLAPQRQRLGEIAYRDRTVMTWYVAGETRHPQAAAIFRRGLDLWDVRAVCLANTPLAGQARAILREAGFRRRVQGLNMEIWVRPRPPGPGAGPPPAR